MDGPDTILDGDWESDDEFEKSVLEQSHSSDQSISTSSVVAVSKPSNIKPTKCSTPLPGKPTENAKPVISMKKVASRNHGDVNANSHCSPLRNATVSSRSNFTEPSPITAGPTRRKRRFPGPAGTLPKLTQDINLKKLKETVTIQNDSENDLPEVALSSQGSQSMSVSGCPAWKTLVEDLELSSEHLQMHSVRNALCNASKKRLPDGKVPLLVVVVDSINKSLPDATVTLRDLTDSIQGVIHRVLMKQHREKLKMGSALLLKQTSVFSPSPRRQYLNITPNNLLQIYSESDKSTAILSTTVAKSSVPLHALLTHPISCSSSAKSTPTTPTAQLEGLFTISKPNTILSNTLASSALSTTTPVKPANSLQSSHKVHSDNIAGDSKNTSSTTTGQVTATLYHANTRSTNSVLVNSVPVESVTNPQQTASNTNTVSDVFGNDDDELSDLDLDDF